jgi:hydrogenase expression/formation protein HypC
MSPLNNGGTGPGQRGTEEKGMFMCLAIPGRIEQLLDEDHDYAVVDVLGVRRKINISLLKHEGVQPGEWVLIHVGLAMSKISREHAEEQLDLLAMLGEEKDAVREVRGYRFDDAAVGGARGNDEIRGRVSEP